MIYDYIFTGVVHPERARFSIATELRFMVRRPDLTLEAEAAFTIQDSIITVTLRSGVDHLKNQRCNLETLKNIVAEGVSIPIDIYCFVKSYSYDLELTTVVCKELDLNHTFGVQGEWNIVKNDAAAEAQFVRMCRFFDRAERMVLKDALADFRRSIKYPSMTASFCFRAIETIRTYFFEDKTITDDGRRRQLGWEKLRKELGLHVKDFDEIQAFALPNRHGVYPAVSYEQREKIMNFTRRMIERVVSALDGGGTV